MSVYLTLRSDCSWLSLFLLRSFSVPAFDSLIIVGTNNISEKSLIEINLKVRRLWAWPPDVRSVLYIAQLQMLAKDNPGVPLKCTSEQRFCAACLVSC